VFDVVKVYVVVKFAYIV